LGDPLKGNLLLFYKPLHLEAQQVSTRIEVRRHQLLIDQHACQHDSAWTIMFCLTDYTYQLGKVEGRGSPDVANSDFVLLTGGVHQAWDPHVSDRTLGALQG
jgi:hypothetical protein